MGSDVQEYEKEWNPLENPKFQGLKNMGSDVLEYEKD